MATMTALGFMPRKVLMRLMGLLSRFSVEQEDVVGVDISNKHIRIAQLSKTKNRWVLEKLGYRYLDSDVSDLLQNVDLYANKLRELLTTTKTTTVNAALSIPITSAIIRVVKLPLMTDDELQRAIDTNSLWVNTIQLTEKLEEYSIFWQVISRTPADNTMDILFVASKLADIKAYTTIAAQAGLNPVVIDIRCFATQNAYKLPASGAADSDINAILELGPDENYLLIIQKGNPFIADIYISEADRDLLRTPGKDPTLLERFCETYATQVRHAIHSFESRGSSKTLIDRINLVSPLPDVQTILRMLAVRLDGYKMDLFDPIQHLTVPENLKEKLAAEPNPSVFTSVLGLATRKLDVFGYYKFVTAVNNINLLPSREIVRVGEKTRILSGLLLGVVVVVIAVAIGLVSWLQGQTKEELLPQVQETTELEKKLALLNADIEALKADRERYQTFAESVLAQGVEQDHVFMLIDELMGAVPHGVWLSEIDYKGADTMTVNGEALNEKAIYRFVEKLNHGLVIQRASLKSIREGGDPRADTRLSGRKNFELHCTLIAPSTATSAGKRVKQD